MYLDKKILALIPARGGSKGLPGKNIKPLLGKPLIAWTIAQAKEISYIDRIVVSTEDEEIAEIARGCGGEVPFLRPEELATDEASGMDVIIHALDWFARNNQSYDILLLLQPTSPLRKGIDIDNAAKLLFSLNARAVVSVCETEHHPYWTNTLPKDNRMKNFIRPEIMNKNRQELPVFYRVNGAIYIAYSDYLTAHRSFIGNETYAYIMPKERSVDIDCDTDFMLAELLLRKELA